MNNYKIYFLSTGRTGTNTIYNFLVKYYPELGITHQIKGSRILNIIGNIALIKSFSFVKNKLYTKNPPSLTIDPLQSVPIYLYLTKNADKSVKVVHVVRDPRNFVTSFMNWKSQSLKKIILHYLIPFWQPNPFLLGKCSFRHWLKMDKFSKFCWIWKYKNEIFHDLRNNTVQYHLLKIEDLINHESRKEILIKLLEFLELDITKANTKDIFEKKINASIKIKFPEWKSWNNKKKEILHYYCGNLMDEFGYE